MKKKNNIINNDILIHLLLVRGFIIILLLSFIGSFLYIDFINTLFSVIVNKYSLSLDVFLYSILLLFLSIFTELDTFLNKRNHLIRMVSLFYIDILTFYLF